MGSQLLGGAGPQESVVDMGGQGLQRREATLDNAMFFIIVLACVAAFSKLPGRASVPWLHGDVWWNHWVLEPLVRTNLAPCGLSFLSGALSRGPPSRRRLQDLVIFVLVPYLLYTVVLLNLTCLWAFALPQWAPDNIFARTLNAAPSKHWYLQCLFYWYLFSYSTYYIAALTRTSRLPWLLSVSGIIVVVSPYIPLRQLSLSYATGFLPCFVAGLVFPTEGLLASIPPSWGLWFIGLCLLAGWAFCANADVGQAIRMLTMTDAYHSAPADCHGWLWWSESLFAALIGITLFLVCLGLLCPRGRTWCTRAGREGFLYAYLLIPIFVMPLWSLVLVYATFPVVVSWLGHFSVHLVELLYCIAFVLVLSSKPIIWLFSPFLQPEWCDRLVFKQQPGAPPEAVPLKCAVRSDAQ